MPVRIYDISKKLGLENKEVLSKAKELGIAARVASSSLDKITAEYLEEQLRKDHPDLTALAPPPAAPAPAPIINEPIVVVSAPPPVEVQPVQAETLTATVILEAPEPPVEAKAEVAEPPQAQPAPKPPPPPPGPKLGEKIGFIELPQKPQPKIADKPGPAKPPPGPQRRFEPGRTDFTRRAGIRSPTAPPAPAA